MGKRKEQHQAELRAHLETQRQLNPRRNDPLITNTMKAHPISYSGSPSENLLGPDVTAHIGMAPTRFLRRARPHLSRRTDDTHVQQAMKNASDRTAAELAEQARRAHTESQRAAEGLEINDALRYDVSKRKAEERHKHQMFVKSQMEEQRLRAAQMVQEEKKEPAGYWGPEEKALLPSDIHLCHCDELMKQMQVNERRREYTRNRDLAQERRLVENAQSQLRSDRMMDRQKAEFQREVLSTTWQSQSKIREVVKHVEKIGMS